MLLCQDPASPRSASPIYAFNAGEPSLSMYLKKIIILIYKLSNLHTPTI